MIDENAMRRVLKQILLEQADDDLMIPSDESDDWTSPTGRKSNAYIAAEREAKQNPLALLQRLGTSAMETPKTGTIKDVENFLRQVIMKNPDLSQVYGKVTNEEGNIYIQRRINPSGGYDFAYESDTLNFPTSNAAAARYISLLLVAAGSLGWIKFRTGYDSVMFGGSDNAVVRVMPKSYETKKTAPEKKAATPKA